jgi:hypothetical protein
MIVAIAGLIAALTGTAIALPGKNTVKSGDIARGQVKTRDIASGAVVPNKTNIARADTANGVASTILPAATAADGPSVSVDVPSGSMVAVHVRADMRQTGADGIAAIHLYEPTALPGAPRVLGTNSNTTETRYISPGSGDSLGVTSQVRSGWIVLSDVPSGRRTFSLRYSTESGTGAFENRRLQVAVIR